ncbi:hypothetical protein JG687_00005353 [Phytophthora cactorum]|uniref:Uncharacterized protein n=1 Tax=Phytophthora cactorum TaxID=29920 RepID=A0A8T1UNF4_9STRA|nr:hypothetical protein JG687_00005353 [Phytophthora cactorum]
MDNTPPLLMVLFPALPVDAHILQRVNDFLMPEAINAAVYNDLQIVVRVYGKRWMERRQEDDSTSLKGCTPLESKVVRLMLLLELQLMDILTFSPLGMDIYEW